MFRQRRPTSEEVEARPELAEKYAEHLADMNRRMAAKVAAAQEIGPLPKMLNPERRESCRWNLQLFAEKYVPGLFKGITKRWSPFHITAFRILQESILKGGLFAIAIPRGSGKSAMIKAAMIWAAVYGHCKFAVVVCATNRLAINFLKSIKKQFRGSRPLFEDFPEVCYPIRRLDNKASKCNGQKLDGIRTAIEWANEHIVLPTIPGSEASGFKIAISGITGSGLRGLVEGLEDATEVRPDIVAIDDFQTKGSAKSPNQTTTRLEIVRGDILGMAGPGEKMTVFSAVTVIECEDGADQLLQDPNWQGMRFGILQGFPDKVGLELWRKYYEILLEARAQKLGVAPANDFYRANRTAMDGDWAATWEDRFNPETEVSAIQHAMNLYFMQGPKAFWAEYMNTPAVALEKEMFKVEAKEVCKRLSRVRRYAVPADHEKITVQVDCQGELLWYVVCSWRSDFTGSLIDYGWFPDQGRRNFTLDNLSRTLQSESGCEPADFDGAISWGLEQIGKHVLDRKYEREDGLNLKITKGLIDVSWKPSLTPVARFCRLSKWAGIVIPARGWALNSLRRRRISEWVPKDGEKFPPPAERPECEWMLTSPKKHKLQECMFDTNHWKGRVIKALLMPPASSGSLSLYGTDPVEHQMLADHLASHRAQPVQYGDVKDISYTIRPGISRDDLLDGAVGCAVAASIEGIKLGTEQAIAAVTKKRTFTLPGARR